MRLLPARHGTRIKHALGCVGYRSCTSGFVPGFPAGMYADLDVEALRNMEEVLVGYKVFLARMGPQEDFSHSVPNAWFASGPGHPLWLFCIQQVIARQAMNTPTKCALPLTATCG